MFFWAAVIVSFLSLRWSSLVSWQWQRDLIWDLPVTPSGSVELDQEAPAIDFSLFFYFKPSTVTVSTQLWPQGCCQFSTDPWDHLYRKDYARAATHSRAPVALCLLYYNWHKQANIQTTILTYILLQIWSSCHLQSQTCWPKPVWTSLLSKLVD